MEQANKHKAAVHVAGAGKQYGSFWALKNCDSTIPAGSICALVGPNGAGKTTLLKLLTGLNQSATGSVMVLGRTPGQQPDYLADIGYLAQEVPLYRHMTAAEHIAMGAHLNQRWDGNSAAKRLTKAGIPLNKAVGKLSGGQRAQVGLAMALAKKPRLLLLDEPVAALDPLARVEFLTSLTEAAADADGELTVVMSSHLLSDLERVCDFVVILASGKTQLSDEIEQVLQTHKLLSGPRGAHTANPAYTIIKESHSASQTNLLVRLNGTAFRDATWQVREPDIEEIVLAYMAQPTIEGGAQ
ncbi:MAG TPA: ABC transporter ATP-binding protein [Candidatus Saccharimonadales bacterium]|nr:ABC transporter ATP-binding protein [Candidatus Saccharimonadales bacterium]